MIRVTGVPWNELKTATGKPALRSNRATIVLDDLYQALYPQFARNARGRMTRCHLETLLSPLVLKVLIRIRFIKSHHSQSLPDILRGVVIVGRCLRRRLYHPEDGSPPVPWTLRRLRAACYRRRLSDSPTVPSPEGGDRLDKVEVARIIGYTKWLYWIVCATNMWDKFEDLTCDEATEWAANHVDVPIHDLFQRCTDKDGSSHHFTRAEGPSFPSIDINVRTLRELGGLELRWTDNYADHLKLSSTSHGKRLYIFWNRSSYDMNNQAYYEYDTRSSDHPVQADRVIAGPVKIRWMSSQGHMH